MAKTIRCGGRTLSERELVDVVSALAYRDMIVYPTETLYGIGANAMDDRAVTKVNEIKGRDMPISVAVTGADMAKRFADITPLARKIMKDLPGPITLVLDAKENYISPMMVSDTGKVGVRVPDSEVAMQIIEAFGPITSTSANKHGGPDSVNTKMAKNELEGGIAIYIDGGEPKYSAPSTVVDVSGDSINVLREGVISEKELVKKYG